MKPIVYVYKNKKTGELTESHSGMCSLTYELIGEKTMTRKAKLEKALRPPRYIPHESHLAELRVALIEAVEALEYLLDDSQYGEYVEEALAKLDKALEGIK